jgi:REP element-mobilizing transposase RayT
MPKSTRPDAPGVLHHVMRRRIEGKKIFGNNAKRKDFLERLAELTFDGAIDIYSWTLMPNYFHIFVNQNELK